MRDFKKLWLLFCLLPTLCFAQSGGFPSRPTFQQTTVSSGTVVEDRWYNSASTTTNRATRIGIGNTGVYNAQYCTDDFSSCTSFMSATRSANTATSIDLTGTAVTINAVDMTPETGSFTCAMTGFTTDGAGGLNKTILYTRIGKTVTLTMSGGSFTATSNSTSMQCSGTPLPASLRPAITNDSGIRFANQTGMLIDNGTVCTGCAVKISNTGDMVFYRGATPTGWTNTGSKGIVYGDFHLITYPLF